MKFLKALLSLSLIWSAPVPGWSKTAKKSKRYVKQVINYYPRYSTAVLGLRQFTKLSHADQVRYIKNLRSTYVLLEHFFAEYTKRNRYRGASNEVFNLTPEQELWKMLMFGFEAQAAENIGTYRAKTRLTDGDVMIAGNIVTQQMERAYGGRLQAAQGSCSTGQVQCNGTAFGVSSCIQVNPTGAAPNKTYALTNAACPDALKLAVEKLNSTHKADYEAALKNYEKVLGKYGRDINTKEALLARKQAILGLKRFPEGIDAYVHMAKLAADWMDAVDSGTIEGRSGNVPDWLDLFPNDEKTRKTLKNWDELTKDKEKLVSFFNNFDEEARKLDFLMFGIARYCESPVEGKVLKGAMRDKGAEPALYEQDQAIVQACRQNQNDARNKNCIARIDCKDIYVRDYDDSGNPIPRKSGEVTQRGRLVDILKALDKKQREFYDISRRLPDKRTPDTIETPVVAPRPPKIPDVVVKPRPPYSPLLTDGKIFGCENSINRDPHLENSPMACFKCLLERDKRVRDKNNDYVISDKWTTLVNIGSRFCSDAKGDGSVLGAESALNYAQIFGHCSASTYNWNDSITNSELTARVFQNMDAPKKYSSSQLKQEIQKIKGFRHLQSLSDDIDMKNDEDPEEYVDRALREMFGMSYRSQNVKVHESDWGVLSDILPFLTKRTVAKAPGLEDLFCPKPGASVGDRIAHFKSKTSEFEDYLKDLEIARHKAEEKAKKSSSDRLKKAAEIANDHAFEVSSLVSCMKESLKNAEELYHPKLQKSKQPQGFTSQHKAQTNGCFVFSTKTSDFNTVTTDVPPAYIQMKGGSFNNCGTGFARYEDPTGKNKPEVMYASPYPGKILVPEDIKDTSGRKALSIEYKKGGQIDCPPNENGRGCNKFQYEVKNWCTAEEAKKANESGDWMNFDSPYIDKRTAE